MNSKCSLLIAVVVVVTFGWVASAPIRDDNSHSLIFLTSTTESPLVASSTNPPRSGPDNRRTTPLPSTTWQPETASTIAPEEQDSSLRSAAINSADYISSDAEYQALLDQLRLHAENDVASNVNNYARDDESVDDLMRRFEEREQQLQEEELRLTIGTIEGSIREENGEQLTEDQPTQRTSEPLEHDDEEECPICLTPIEELSQSPVIPCGHKFHGECLARWRCQPMITSTKCPVCRASI